MKHTLPSLLITIVLTLPTAFGGPLELTGNSAATAATHSSSITVPKRSKSTLGPLNLDVLKEIAGSVYEKKCSPGFTNLQALQALALTCSWLYELVKPMLNVLNAGRHSYVIHTLTQWFPLTFENHSMLKLIGTNTASPFNEALAVAFALKFWMIPMRPDELTALVAAINDHPTFTDVQKAILIGILPNATLLDIKLAAGRLRKLGFPNRAAVLYEKAAHHPNAIPYTIRLAANGLKALGYHSRAAALYEQSVHHPNATPWDIQLAADGLNALGSTERAAALYEQSAKDLRATPWDIYRAANGLKALGTKYHPKAAELYVLSASHQNTIPMYIQSAVDGLDALGYHDKATAIRNKFEQSN